MYVYILISEQVSLLQYRYFREVCGHLCAILFCFKFLIFSEIFITCFLKWNYVFTELEEQELKVRLQMAAWNRQNLLGHLR